MRTLFASLIMTAGAAMAASAAEPDICHFGTPPADAPVSEYSDTNPFLGLELILGNLYVNRALCGHDVSADIRFWRSYYEVFGCTATSDAGGAVESYLFDAPYYHKAQFDRQKARYPDMIKARCDQLAQCTIPEKFSLTERGFINCPE